MRAAKLALARKKLKDHQDKKLIDTGISNEDSNTCSLTQPEIIVVSDNNECDINNVTHKVNSVIEDTAIADKQNENEDWKQQHIKTTEILTFNNKKMEMQINDLKNKISQLEVNYDEALTNISKYQHYNNNLEENMKKLKTNNSVLENELSLKNLAIKENNDKISELLEKNNDLIEHLDLTKTNLTSKEAEIVSLHNILANLQKQLDMNELHLQQLNSNSVSTSNEASAEESSRHLKDKIVSLENEIQLLKNQQEQINALYAQHVSELNQEINVFSNKNIELAQSIQTLSSRENNLVNQISVVEQQLQQFRQANVNKNDITKEEFYELHEKYNKIQNELKEMNDKYIESQNKARILQNKVQSTEEVISNMEATQEKPDVDLTKLNADIVSDKVAAQRATIQNKKLKAEVSNLQEVSMKLSKDKLQLIEKLDAEKYLNRELTIKLSDTEEKLKETHSKLLAKDSEMIRLLSDYNEINSQLSEKTKIEYNSDMTKEDLHLNNSLFESESEYLNQTNEETQSTEKLVTDCDGIEIKVSNITIREAMSKLQDRFLQNMKEFADLSDEKSRLEHLVMQLQNETDTICEYVALYQQQRGILKKREADRSEQLKIFDTERERMHKNLDRLDEIIQQLANDKELQPIFQVEPRKTAVTDIMKMIRNLKNNHILVSNKHYSEMENIYPCAWCSGNISIV